MLSTGQSDHLKLPAILLRLLSVVYEAVVRVRLAFYRYGLVSIQSLPQRVISVGNLTVGGTGKTPCVAWIAGELTARGEQVAILSRGYRRQSRGRVEVSDGKSLLVGADEAGDEPWLLARSIPGVRVVVDGQRYLAGQWLLGKGVPVTTFLLDDGYQHLRLARDLNLLLIDAGDPLPRARMIPEGRLREPLDQLYRADAVIVTRCDEPHDEMALATLLDRHLRHGTPVFHAAHALTRFYRLGTGDPVDTASIGRAGAIAGIARPERFYHDLRARGLDLVWTGSYPDHHRYSPADLQLIATRMAATGAQSLLMTEKDAANWPPGASAGLSLVVCQIEFRCREDEQLRSLLQQLRT